MRKTKALCMILCAILAFSVLVGCDSGGTKVSFTDAQQKAFQFEALRFNLNGKTLKLGMTKSEIEKILNESGKCFYFDGKDMEGDWVQGSYEETYYQGYTRLDNYYLYPSNRMIIVYRVAIDGRKTNAPALAISVNNPALIDSEGFSPDENQYWDVRETMISRYGEEMFKLTGSMLSTFYNEQGRCAYSDDSCAWKTYYAYDGKALDAIAIGTDGVFRDASELFDQWK